MDVGRIGAAYGTPSVPPARGDRPVPPAAKTSDTAEAEAAARAMAQRQAAEARAAQAAAAAQRTQTPSTEVRTERHAATGTYVYEFVDPASNQVMYEIPSRRVLDLVASLMAKLGHADDAAGHGQPPAL